MAFGVANCVEHQNSKILESFHFLYFKQLMAMANDHFQQLMQNKVSRKWFLCGVQSLNKLLPNLAFNLPIGKNIGYMDIKESSFGCMMKFRTYDICILQS